MNNAPKPNDNDVEKNNDNESTTFSIDDDDECVIEYDDEDDENRDAIDKIFGNGKDEEVPGVYNIHDQLPSVEEVKASHAYLPTARLIAKSHRRKIYVALAATVLAVTVLSTIISAFSKSSKASNPVSVVESRVEDVIQYIYSYKVSSLPSLENPFSAEHHAAQFLANGDAFDAQMSEVSGDQRRRFLERYILALLYYQTHGQEWKEHYNFLSKLDHCKWQQQYSTPQGRFVRGVQCDENGFVIDLDLSNNNLVAPYIPQEIVHLELLQRLHLYGNTIGGGVPDLTPLKNLKSLGLMDLDLVGTIPGRLASMTALTTLALGRNKLTKTIPESFAQMTNLRILGLDGLMLSGRVNPLLKLNKLEALYLEDNNLSGEIYHNDWQSMKELDVSNNMIDGRIPDELFHNTNLHVIDLHRNIMFGDFPQKLISNDAIEYIALQGNTFSGTLSDRIGYLNNLKHLDISSCRMSGTLPDTISLLTNLVSLNTSGNKFSKQPLSNYFSKLSNLQDISMKGNAFTGTLPEFFGLMTNLKMLDLDGNHLVGTIPTWYGILQNLVVLQLNRNQLTGTIPSELANMGQLRVLLLDGNNLSGKTKEICAAPRKHLTHFVTDCYPSMKSDEGPEVECHCCTLCCNDENLQCNNKDWSSSYDPKTKYGYIRPAYEFSLDQAPEEWQKHAHEEAQNPYAPSVETVNVVNSF